MTPRVVTGLGVASALGVGRRALLDALQSGVCPTFHPVPPATPESPTSGPALSSGSGDVRVAEVPGFDATKYLGDKGLRSLDRLTKLLVVAARLALHDASLKKDGEWTAPAPGSRPWGERVGLVASNAYGSLEAITELHRVAVLEDARYINPSRFPLTVSNSAAGYASIWEDLRAVNVTVSDGNCGGLDAVACADVLLDNQRADALLVGGAEAISDALIVGLRRLGAEARIGEGAALAVLETPEGARARGAEPLARIVGYGTAFAAPERAGALVHAAPDALTRAIEGALGDANISAADVDVVVSGVSGLRAFDDAEFLAIRRALGEGACVVAPKRALGETLGAAGAMGMLAAIGYLQGRARTHQVRGELRAEVRTALVTSLGYYGNASALVMHAA